MQPSSCHTCSETPKIYIVKMQHIKLCSSGSWTHYCYLLAIGGGFASGFIRALSDEGIQKIQDFVKSGGRYLGIGAGAYFGAQAVEFDKGGPQEKCRSDYLLNFYPGTE